MNADAPSIDPKVYARRWRTLAVLSLSLVIIGLDNTILNVALPSLREHFDASNSTLQWIVDSYLLVFAGLLLTMGTLGDRFGRARALQAGLAIFGSASLAVLLVDSAGQLIAIRAAMGVGAALIMPATLSILTNVFPREERAKAIGIWAGMAAIAARSRPAPQWCRSPSGSSSARARASSWARVGTTRVVTAGLAGLGLLLAATLAWTPELTYWPLGLWFFGCALSIGWIMGPATDSVMGAVPEEKSGVASAMNDVARQVAGALGVAVIGSLIGSLYASRVEDATDGLPAGQAAAASDSVGAAVGIAERMPDGAGTALSHAATHAYTDALGLGLLAAATVAIVGAAVVSRLLPAHHRPAEATGRRQSATVGEPAAATSA